MRFASLGSGSRGNALLVEGGDTLVLVDCGFSVRETVRRMGRLGVVPERLHAILVTHEHTDHVSGVFPLASRFGIPVWMSHGTRQGCLPAPAQIPVQLFDSHSPFVIGDLGVQPVPVPHDAREPVQFIFAWQGLRLGVLTDLGEATPHVSASLRGCQGLVLECNHDPDLLAASSYPAFLKRRVAGRLGHLSNQAAADLLRGLGGEGLQHVVAAHLSETSNRPELAVAALADALQWHPERILSASQSHGFDWCCLV